MTYYFKNSKTEYEYKEITEKELLEKINTELSFVPVIDNMTYDSIYITNIGSMQNN